MHKDTWCFEPLVGSIQTPDGMWLNMGRPSRRMTTRIRVTILGNPSITVSWPQRERVGLIFKKGKSPLAFVESLLKKEGFRSPEELRQHFEIPAGLLTCRNIADDSGGLVDAVRADARTVLRQALILGLCGANFYDPNRAVIWTNNSLSRKLDLFEPGRFYADN